MDISARDEEIYQLRKSGVSYSEIARMCDLTRERVRQICIRLDAFNTYPPLQKLLPTLTQRALIFWFNDEHILEYPEKIIAGAKYKDLSTKAQLIGKVGARRLSQALITLGYLKPGDKWFKE
jgi:hypothetical protein